MIKRYTITPNPDGYDITPWSADLLLKPVKVVLESDYDALAAQLAKADVLIRHMRDCLDPRRTPGSLYGRADDYLKRRSVSAGAATDGT